MHSWGEKSARLSAQTTALSAGQVRYGEIEDASSNGEFLVAGQQRF